ncbi:MAG: hypothetical protein GX947_10050 [Tissierellia bacterium]|nr:hypothetical protein [Tissierellia bacterium]
MLKRGLIILLTVCLLLCAIVVFAKVKLTEEMIITPTSTTTIPTEWNEENLRPLIEKVAGEEGFSQVDLLNQLAFHESRWMLYDEILDVNGYFSRGLFHFQLYTFLEQAKLYKVIPKETDIEEGKVLVMNPELQIRTICRMGNNSLKNIERHWVLSWIKIHQ